MKNFDALIELRFKNSAAANTWKVGPTSRAALAAHATKYGPAMQFLPRADGYTEEVLGLPVTVDKRLPPDVVLLVDGDGKELARMHVEI